MLIIFRVFIFFHVFIYGIGSQFLILPFSSKELSIGSHPTFFEHDPVNPSLYHAIEGRPSISFNQGMWFGDVGLTQAGYNFEKNNEKSLGNMEITSLAILYFALGITRPSTFLYSTILIFLYRKKIKITFS